MAVATGSFRLSRRRDTQVGQNLEIVNSDSTLHNVHAMPEVNSQFNEGQPVQGMTSTKKFDKPELKPFRIKCDVHGWMHGWLVAAPSPYVAVTDNGTPSLTSYRRVILTILNPSR